MKFDTIIIGGGLAGITVGERLMASTGKKCAIVAEGLSLRDVNTKKFESLGGTVLKGDRVTGGKIENNVLAYIQTQNLGDYKLTADTYVLATGKFFGRGIVADMEKVYEPIFGLDVDYDPDRSTWFDLNFMNEQKFLSFGLKTDDMSRPSINGDTVENLYAAGEVLSGINGVHPDAEKVIVASAEKVTLIIG